MALQLQHRPGSGLIHLCCNEILIYLVWPAYLYLNGPELSSFTLLQGRHIQDSFTQFFLSFPIFNPGKLSTEFRYSFALLTISDLMDVLSDSNHHELSRFRSDAVWQSVRYRLHPFAKWAPVCRSDSTIVQSNLCAIDSTKTPSLPVRFHAPESRETIIFHFMFEYLDMCSYKARISTIIRIQSFDRIILN